MHELQQLAHRKVCLETEFFLKNSVSKMKRKLHTLYKMS